MHIKGLAFARLHAQIPQLDLPVLRSSDNAMILGWMNRERLKWGWVIDITYEGLHDFPRPTILERERERDIEKMG